MFALLGGLSLAGVGVVAHAAPLRSVADRMTEFGPDVSRRLAPDFARAGLAFPPFELAYLVFKDRRELQVFARAAPTGPWRFVKRYAVKAASGAPGPKLAEGDRQVPEGLYRAESLNPNSRFHLSIRLNYPNEFDRRMALADGRRRLGGDIMIHGNAVSIGCLAMGDRAAEDLFVLAGRVSKERLQVIISPTDFRQPGAKAPLRQGPAWLPTLHADLRRSLAAFPRPPA